MRPNRWLAMTLLFLFVFPVASILHAQTKDPSVEQVYKDALQSYLNGDYDRALAQAATALDKDPSHVGAKNLIKVLAAEKEQEGKTVIWLAGKPSIIPKEQAPALPATQPADPGAWKSLGDRLDRYYSILSGRQNGMEGQMKVVQELVRENSEAQYSEIRASQEAIYRKLEGLENGRDLTLVYLVCGISLFLSLIAFLRTK